MPPARLVVLLHAVVVGLGLLLGVAPAWAEPAIWLVTDRDSRMYLLGSFHYLSPNVSWRTDRIDALLAEAQEVWFEVEEIEGIPSPKRISFLRRYGFDQSRKLTSWLTPDEMKTLATALQPFDLPRPAVEALRPWLAASMAAGVTMAKLGMDPAQGVDRVLYARAHEHGKPMRALEAAEDSFRVLATLPDEVHLAGLRQVLHREDQLGAVFIRLQAAWQRGDEAALERELAAASALEHPAVHEAVFIGRNRAWVETLVAAASR